MMKKKMKMKIVMMNMIVTMTKKMMTMIAIVVMVFKLTEAKNKSMIKLRMIKERHALFVIQEERTITKIDTSLSIKR